MSRDDSIAPPRPGRLPRGLVGMLVLVGLVEVYVDRQGLSFMNEQQLDWKTTTRLASREAAKYDVLCFGDSMVKFGIAPRVLESLLKRPTYNLALLDGKPPATYYLFRRALAAGASPAAVLVDFQPEMIAQSPRHLLENPKWDFALFDPAESFHMAWNYRDPDFFGRLLLARAFPTVRCRNRIRVIIRAELAGVTLPTREANLPVRRNWRINHGGVLLARSPSYRGEVRERDAHDLFHDPWTIEPANASYVHRFLELAEAHKVPVFWILPPNAPEVLARRRQIGLFDRYDAFVRSAVARFPNVTVIDSRPSGYAHTNFVDAVHLDRNGATALTVDVAEAIRTSLASGAPASRWVVLPPYREPAVSLALEDVDQSKAMVKAQEALWRR